MRDNCASMDLLSEICGLRPWDTIERDRDWMSLMWSICVLMDNDIIFQTAADHFNEESGLCKRQQSVMSTREHTEVKSAPMES